MSEQELARTLQGSHKEWHWLQLLDVLCLIGLTTTDLQRILEENFRAKLFLAGPLQWAKNTLSNVVSPWKQMQKLIAGFYAYIRDLEVTQKM